MKILARSVSNNLDQRLKQGTYQNPTTIRDAMCNKIYLKTQVIADAKKPFISFHFRAIRHSKTVSSLSVEDFV